MQQGIDHIRGSPYHPQSQGAVEAFNKTIQNFLYLAKDMNEDNFDLEDSVLDFLLHYNSRVHTTTKFTPYEIMENRFDQNILKQVRDNTLKSRKDRKIKEFEEGQSILISNYVIQPDVNRKYLNYYKPRYQKKGEEKEFFKVKGKIIEEKRNYCKVKIVSKQSSDHILKEKSLWNISKMALK